MLERVIQNLLLKKRLLEAGDERHENIRTLLLLPGGAMRGIYQAGTCLGFLLLGLGDVFDKIVGISTGIGVGSYFLGGLDSAREGTSIYYKECCRPEYISLRRPRKIVNTDFLHRVMREVKPIPESNILAARSELWASVTDLSTGQGLLLDVKQAQPDITAAVIASMAILESTDHPIIVNTRPCADGDLTNPLPIQEIVERFNPSDIVVVTNMPQGYRSPGVASIECIAAYTFMRKHPMREVLLERRTKILADLDYASRLRGVNMAWINPPEMGIGLLTQDSAKLQAAALASMRSVCALFGRSDIECRL